MTKRKPSLDDLTTTWTKDSSANGFNPMGPHPGNSKAEHYTEKDETHWRVTALYGKQEPLNRKGRKP